MRLSFFSEWPIEEFIFSDICVAYVGNCWPTSLYFSEFDCHDNLGTASIFHDVAFVSFYIVFSVLPAHINSFLVLSNFDTRRFTAPHGQSVGGRCELAFVTYVC